MISASPKTINSDGKTMARRTSIVPARSRAQRPPSTIRTAPPRYEANPEPCRVGATGGSIMGSTRGIVSVALTAPPCVDKTDTRGNHRGRPHELVEPRGKIVGQEQESDADKDDPRDQWSPGAKVGATKSDGIGPFLGDRYPGDHIEENARASTDGKDDEDQSEPDRINTEIAAQSTTDTGNHPLAFASA